MNRDSILGVLLALASVSSGCSDDPTPSDPAIQFGTMGPLVAGVGQGSWRFGVATAATQIEDMNPATDWFLWTQPEAQGGLGHGDFVGDAVKGYSLVDTDLSLVGALGVDSYRFSIEWARIEPVKGQIDQAAIAHYRAELESLRAMGIRPLVTLHHFSNPVWVADPRTPGCQGGPVDTNLCGFGSPGGPQIIQAMADHAALVAQQFGDLVDEWGTVNEPMNYLLASYGIGNFPPGQISIMDIPQFVNVVRDYISGSAAMYHAIKDNDTIDADGDGIAASVGLSLSVADWEPTRFNEPSTNPDDVAARDRLVYLFHYIFADSVTKGTFDSDLDGRPDEQHPEWANTLDWLGLQYYFRAGVSADRPLLPAPVALTPCFGGFNLGACLPAPDPSYCVPAMGYEGYADGIHDILHAYADRYPGLPLMVTEAGISTDTGVRRAENIVRVLESVTRARDEGVDVRGYYHWSLTDNFEWAEGFAPHFGLYSIDYASYARAPSEGADVYRDIAHARTITSDQRTTYGGTGPMTAEVGYSPDSFCTKVTTSQ